MSFDSFDSTLPRLLHCTAGGAPWRLMPGASGPHSPPSSIPWPMRPQPAHCPAHRRASRPSWMPSGSPPPRVPFIRPARIRRRPQRPSGIFCAISSAVCSTGCGEALHPAAVRHLAPEAPALGPTREQQERWQRLAAAWSRLQDAQRRLQRLWSDALGEAARAFVSQSRRGGRAAHARGDAWVIR